MIDFKCNSCGEDLDAPESMAGQWIKCPLCHKDQKVRTVEPKIQETKDCPFCGEEVLSAAKKCKHCNEFFDGSNNASAPTVVSAPVVVSAPPMQQTVVFERKTMGCCSIIFIIIVLILICTFG
jgi:predicted RNA-binding Zn-ribbon protein involved in translation (DUF1610 family)